MRSSRRVALLTAGGTIASASTAGRGVVAVPGDALAALAHDVSPGLRVEHEEVLRTNSYAMSVEEVDAVAGAACAAAAIPDTVGVVVAHGTDTMEETAYLTDLRHDGPVPIAFFGAQRPSDDADPDGPRNLADALALVSDARSVGSGVSIVMGGLAVSARSGVKADTRDLRAFSPRFGPPLGEVAGGIVTLRSAPRRRRTRFPQHGGLRSHVALVALAVGSPARPIEHALADGADGIVLQALGLGNASPPVVDAVGASVRDGVPVVVSTRCARGPVAPVYGAGGGFDLAAVGAWFSGDLPASKARILLMAVLGATDDLVGARRLFDEHVGSPS